MFKKSPHPLTRQYYQEMKTFSHLKLCKSRKWRICTLHDFKQRQECISWLLISHSFGLLDNNAQI